MKKEDLMFKIWIMKILELHKFIRLCKDNEDLDNEEYYLKKYFELYEHLIKVYSKEKVDNELISYSQLSKKR